MFHSAALKLTLWYLGIIMVLSLCFSVIIYNLSGNELAASSRRQDYFLNDRLPRLNFNNFDQLRNQDIADARRKLRDNLVLFNAMVLIAGGAASYALARRTLEPIESALESQKRFTGDASHELRTPLTVMQTEIEVALRSPSLTKAEAVGQLRSNLEEVAKLKALSDGLLKLASMDKDGLAMRPVSLKKILETVVDRWQAKAEEKDIKLIDSVTDLLVKADPDSLAELLSLLVDNAIKYSAKGATVKISSQRVNKETLVHVIDDGAGIAAEHMPKIFDRFYRADAARSGSNGYGLGLSIAKRIAELHGGSISVRSQKGKGSTFTVHLESA